MKMSDVMVSICCLTYNQESYIRKCLDSIIMQKTDFKYELLIHDDASTDNTQAIILEYQKNYPEIIKPILQSENKYSKGIKLDWEYLFPLVNGKYIAFCEGDDYWTDEYKLQKQYDKMEKNTDSMLCVHKVEIVDHTGNLLNDYCPNDTELFTIIHNGYIMPDELMKYICTKSDYPFQTTSFFLRSECMLSLLDKIPDFIQKSEVGDVPMLLLSLNFGKICYIDDVMSCYRSFTPGGWNDKRRSDIKMYDRICDNHILYFRLYDEYTNYRYHSLIEYYVKDLLFKKDLKHTDYHILIKKQHREVFKNLPFKTKTHIVLLSLFPSLTKILEKLIRKKS